MVAAWRGRGALGLAEDPWADALAGEDGRVLARRHDPSFPDAALWMAVRTRWLDDVVRRWTEPGGMKQVVVLGAGMDTRSMRLRREGVEFFEVDHPGSQEVKRDRLADLDGYDIGAATYVPCDLEKENFVQALEASGLRVDEPVLIIWEGVVPYLSREAVLETLRRVATGLVAESLTVFDTVGKRLVQNRSTRTGDQELVRLVEELGEPFRFGLDDPVPLLHEAGLHRVRTVSFDEACLELTGTYERSRAFRFQHFVLVSRAAAIGP